MSTNSTNPIQVPRQTTTIYNPVIVADDHGNVVSVSPPASAGLSATLNFSTASGKVATLTVVNGIITAQTVT